METGDLMDNPIEEEPRRCTATSKQSGERCKRRPHPGSNVCVIHGAGAPQTKRTARERLEALVDPAVNTLRKVLQHGLDTGNTPSAVRAALGILDRCGFHPSQAIELTGRNGGPIETQEVGLEVDKLPLYVKQLLVVVGSGRSISKDLEELILKEVGAAYLEVEYEVMGETGPSRIQ